MTRILNRIFLSARAKKIEHFYETAAFFHLIAT